MQVQTDEVIQKAQPKRNVESGPHQAFKRRNLPFTDINGDTPGKGWVLNVPDSTKNSDIVREARERILDKAGPSPMTRGNSIIARRLDETTPETNSANRATRARQKGHHRRNRVNAFGRNRADDLQRQGG